MAATRELKDATEQASTTAYGVAKLAASGGTTAGTVVQATDSRLADARAPTAHAASHKTGGSDAIRLDELVAPTADVSLNSHKITNLAAPTSANDAARKADVDAAVAGLSWKQAVRAATTANGALATAFANGQVIDGVTLATGDRILIKDQTTGSENGIYVVAASGAPTRATDADSATEVLQASVYVEEGTTNADTQWVGTANAPITLGTTALPFSQLTSGGGGAALTVEEVDGSPTDSAITKIVFPNGTLTIVGHVATFTPTGGGGGLVIQAPDGTNLTARGHLQFLGVIPADDSGNDRTIVDLRLLPGYELLAEPPATAHAKDDEFTGTSLDAKWTNPVVSGRTNTLTFAAGWLNMEPSESGSASIGNAGSNGIRQVAPTGSFTVTARLADNAYTNDDARIGLFVGRTTGGKGHLWGPYLAAGFLLNYCTFNYSESAQWTFDSDTTTNFAGGIYGKIYVRIQWDASASTLTFSQSTDGVFWTVLVTRTGQSQPDRIGLGLWSNSGVLRANHALAVDFFRVTEP